MISTLSTQSGAVRHLRRISARGAHPQLAGLSDDCWRRSVGVNPGKVAGLDADLAGHAADRARCYPCSR